MLDYVRAFGRKHRVSAAILFGSRASGRARRNSDIDLALFLDEPVAHRKLILMQELSALSWIVDPKIEAIPFESSELRDPPATSFVAEILRTGRYIYRRRRLR